MSARKPHIVIIGAGFGGIYTARALESHARRGAVTVTLIDRLNYFLFTPLLHEVATGGLSPVSVTEPLREIFKRSPINILQGTVSCVKETEQEICINGEMISYDYLVIATGSTTAYHGIPGAREHTISLKTLFDAQRIRNHIIDSFEQAILSTQEDERAQLLTFAVVGGGPTGVEVAGELVEFICGIAKRYYRRQLCTADDHIRVLLIDKHTSLVKNFSANLQKIARERLAEKGVELYLGTGVERIEAEQIMLTDGRSVRAHTIIWTSGVTPTSPDSTAIEIDRYLRKKTNQRIFALGDVARHTENPQPMLAQVAKAQAKVVSHNIIASIEHRALQPFSYKLKGILFSVGQWFAAGEIRSVPLQGRVAWWIWRTVYLFTFLSWKKRFRIAFEWTINLFYPRDITKL